MLRHTDFVALQETYSTQAMESGFRPTLGSRVWWAHDTVRCADRDPNTRLEKTKGGIALVAKYHFFLRRFKTHAWNIIIPGTAAILQLMGEEGSLDIWCIYLYANDSRERVQAFQAFAKHSQNSDKCPSILVGDWNFATRTHDRFSKTHATWTGDQRNPETNTLLRTH